MESILSLKFSKVDEFRQWRENNTLDYRHLLAVELPCHGMFYIPTLQVFISKAEIHLQHLIVWIWNRIAEVTYIWSRRMLVYNLGNLEFPMTNLNINKLWSNKEDVLIYATPHECMCPMSQYEMQISHVCLSASVSKVSSWPCPKLSVLYKLLD